MAKRKVFLNSICKHTSLKIIAEITTDGLCANEIIDVHDSLQKSLFDLARGKVSYHNPLLQNISVK